MGNVQGTGSAVDHGQTIQKETTGQGTQHEILHGCLCGTCIVPAQRHQCITRQREHFEPQVDDQEVVARDHHVNTEQREHGEGEQLTAVHHFPLARVLASVNQCDQHGDCRKALEPIAHWITDDHSAKTVGCVTAGRVHGQQDRQSSQRQQGKDVRGGAAG